MLCEPAEVLGGVESGRGGGATDWSWGGREFRLVANGWACCRGARWSRASPTFVCAVVRRCGWVEDKERLEDVGLAASGLLDFGLRTFAKREDLRDLKLGLARSFGSSGLFARWWLAMKGRASSVVVDMLGSWWWEEEEDEGEGSAAAIVAVGEDALCEEGVAAACTCWLGGTTVGVRGPRRISCVGSAGHVFKAVGRVCVCVCVCEDDGVGREEPRAVGYEP